MKRQIFLILAAFLFFDSTITNAQNYYYWSNGKKYNLELNPEKQYILIKGQNKSAIAQSIQVSESNISSIKPIVISRTINTQRASKLSENELHWAFVNSRIDKAKVHSSDIIYASPSFLVNGKEVGMSQYIYVKLKQEKDVAILESLARENMVEIIGNNRFMPLWYILSCDKNSKGNALEMANLFYESGFFDSAEPDLMVDFLMGCTNDPSFTAQWHLNNTGQAGGTVGNDIKACQAWNITMGCANVIVAVLDNGLEFNHPDFNNISPNSFDTQNGTSPSVIRGDHGVPVAGVIGATRNNSLGVAGVSPNVQLMSISNDLLLAPLLSQRLADGINFAWQNGASIINNSWGHNSIEQQGLINDAINNAVTQGRGGLGTIVVCISQNDGANSITFPSNNPQTIAVGAINRTSSRASFSNYGTGIDVVAPGVSISTTDRQGALGFNQTAGADGNYTSLDGTSFAAPQVSAIAALILSINPNLTVQQVRNIIQSTTDKVGGVTYTLNAGEQAGLTWNNQMGYGRVNAFNALTRVRNDLNVNISGPDLVCTTGTFTLNNNPFANTTWTVTPSYLVTPSSGTGTSANLTKAGNGNPTITFNSGCGTSFSRTFHTGPYSSSDYVITGPSSAPCKSYVYYSIPTLAGVTSINWIWPSNWTYVSGQNTTSLALKTGTYSGSVGVGVNNTCGQSGSYYTKYTSVTGYCGYSAPLVYPNPAEDEITISFVDSTSTAAPVMRTQEFDAPYDVKLFNDNQELIYSTQSKSPKLTIPIANLPDGYYYLNILNTEGVIQRKVLVGKNP